MINLKIETKNLEDLPRNNLEQQRVDGKAVKSRQRQIPHFFNAGLFLPYCSIVPVEFL